MVNCSIKGNYLMKKIIIAGLLLALFATSPYPAVAHAQMELSTPSRNQVVKTPPRLVWIEFDGNLIDLGIASINRITVTNSKKLRVDIGGTIVGGARITTKIKSGIEPGKYLVAYRVVSEDGHPVEGSYSFTYKP